MNRENHTSPEAVTKTMVVRLVADACFYKAPVRLVKNDFFKQVEEAESRGATTDELRTLLGKGRAKKGIFEGDLFEGELEIGQVASCIHKLQTVDEVMKELVEDFNAALNRVNELKRFI